MHVSPGASGTETPRLITGMSIHSPSSMHGVINSYGQYSFLFRNQLNAVVYWLGRGGGIAYPEDSVTVKTNFYGMTAGHELGIQLAGLTEARYDTTADVGDNVN